MNKLNFYEVDKEYISYLKNFEPKIPNISYSTHDKFVCGVILKIDNIKYFAPISSYKIPQRTNFIIRNENNTPISSIRFSYMFPSPDEAIKLKDFSNEEYRYRRLLMTELNYCNNNANQIYDKAKVVYNIGCNKDHYLNNLCCDFKLLEEKYRDYVNMLQIRQSQNEAAVSLQENFTMLENKIRAGEYTPEDIEQYNRLQVDRLNNSIGSVKDDIKNLPNLEPEI